jgi:probable F420-dependent oxidoreductase
MAATTERIQFITNVFILPLRNPIEVARGFATLALLSGGRVALGTGAGWMADEYQASNVDFATRGRRYTEAITILRKLWSGQMVEHHGSFFDFPPIKLNPAPQQQIPVYVAGPSEPAMRRAAHVDGWISGHLPSHQVADAVALLRRYREEAGRADEPFEVITFARRDIDQLRRLRDHGVTAVIDIPPGNECSLTITLGHKRDGLQQFADTIIARF